MSKPSFCLSADTRQQKRITKGYLSDSGNLKYSRSYPNMILDVEIDSYFRDIKSRLHCLNILFGYTFRKGGHTVLFMEVTLYIAIHRKNHRHLW